MPDATNAASPFPTLAAWGPRNREDLECRTGCCREDWEAELSVEPDAHSPYRPAGTLCRDRGEEPDEASHDASSMKRRSK